ncbi:MAG: hypothetical protein ABSB18_06370 [Candidatus Omnitrophota bacterium]
MGILGNIKYFVLGLFNKLGAFIKKMWDLASPFLKEALSESAQELLATGKQLLNDAVQHVEDKGLPTTKEKQDEFYSYMATQAGSRWTNLAEFETDTLRQMALGIFKAAAKKALGQ